MSHFLRQNFLFVIPSIQVSHGSKQKHRSFTVKKSNTSYKLTSGIHDMSCSHHALLCSADPERWEYQKIFKYLVWKINYSATICKGESGNSRNVSCLCSSLQYQLLVLQKFCNTLWMLVRLKYDRQSRGEPERDEKAALIHVPSV